MTRLPDFYIVGAPKCGTSALYTYLKTHPDIAMSSRKEPSYWATDIEKREAFRRLDSYLHLWDGAAPAALRGEASPAYLRSAAAIPAIRKASPDARFIVLLRNPVEMAQSWHSQMLKNFDEDVASFETAWGLQRLRAQGSRIPPECVDPANLQYRRVCALGEQLERFVSLVPEEQRLILLFDDFASDTRACYLQTLAFLGVADDGRTQFEKVNANRNRRSVRLANLYRRSVRGLGRLHRPLRGAMAGLGFHPGELLNRFNVRAGPRPVLRPEFERQLLAAFAGEVDRIEVVLSRDLTGWRSLAGSRC